MKLIKCVRCGKPTVYDPSNRYRPFCSERCQTLDLGAWADEQYRVPVSGPNNVEATEEFDSPDKDQIN